jgi:hypothetical protein
VPAVPPLDGRLSSATASPSDRIKEAAYTSPSGVRVTFKWERVSRGTELRNTPFEFPGINDAYVQLNGHGPRRYPLRCIFSGRQHDLVATAFEAALLERGEGRLEHPLYGTFNVVPVGSVDRSDDPTNEGNQSIVEVTFMTTVGAVYPSSQRAARNEILAALDGFDVAAAQRFAAATNLKTTIAKANVKGTVQKFLRDVNAEMDSISRATTSVNRQFQDAQNAINLGIDTLVGQPVLLAQQITNLIKFPARAVIGIKSRLEGYARLALRIFGSEAAAGALGTSGTGVSALPSLRLRAANDFHTSDLFASSAVSGSVLSALETTYTNRTDALVTAEAVFAQLDALVPWREERFDGLQEVDTGESYQALQQAVALVAGFLIQASFTLSVERRIVLDRPRTIVDLAAELYGSVDDRLDDLINNNGLTGSEILELPMNRSIVYYV